MMKKNQQPEQQESRPKPQKKPQPKPQSELLPEEPEQPPQSQEHDESRTKPGSQPMARLQPQETKKESLVELKPALHAKLQSEAQQEAQQAAQPESPSETQPEAQPESPSEKSQPETQPGTQPETQPESPSDTQPEAQPETQPGTQPEAQPESPSETQPEAQPESPSETRPKSQREAKSETQSKTQPKIQPQEQQQQEEGHGSWKLKIFSPILLTGFLLLCPLLFTEHIKQSWHELLKSNNLYSEPIGVVISSSLTQAEKYSQLYQLEAPNLLRVGNNQSSTPESLKYLELRHDGNFHLHHSEEGLDQALLGEGLAQILEQAQTIYFIEEVRVFTRQPFKADIYNEFKRLAKYYPSLWQKVIVIFEQGSCADISRACGSIDVHDCQRSMGGRQDAFSLFAHSVAIQDGMLSDSVRFLDAQSHLQRAKLTRKDLLDTRNEAIEYTPDGQLLRPHHLQEHEYLRHQVLLQESIQLTPSAMWNQTIPLKMRHVKGTDNQFRFLILGQAGVGKSTFLSWTAYYSNTSTSLLRNIEVAPRTSQSTTRKIACYALGSNQELSSNVKLCDSRGLDELHIKFIPDIERLVDGKFDANMRHDWVGKDCSAPKKTDRIGRELDFGGFLRSPSDPICSTPRNKAHEMQAVLFLTRYVARNDSDFQDIYDFITVLRSTMGEKNVGLVIGVTHLQRCTFSRVTICHRVFAQNFDLPVDNVLMISKASSIPNYNTAELSKHQESMQAFLEIDAVTSVVTRLQDASYMYFSGNRTNSRDVPPKSNSGFYRYTVESWKWYLTALLCLILHKIVMAEITASGGRVRRGSTPRRERPVEHICPISMEVMEDPVIAADGNTYDRASIEQWFQNSNRSPLSNIALPNTTLIPNITLRNIIQDW